MIYVISDTHFGHRKLEEYEDRKPGFEKDIIRKWNNVVKPTDTVIHLGDWCLGKYKHLSNSKTISYWRGKLQGNVILVRGNHDRETCEWYMNHEFQFCCDRFDMTYRGKRLCFTHKPIPIGNFDYNIHGHSHGNAHRDEEHCDFYGERHIEISIEKMGSVISLKSLVE